MEEVQSLLKKYNLGSLTLKNRVIMAPLTRMRALPGRIPGPMCCIIANSFNPQ